MLSKLNPVVALTALAAVMLPALSFGAPSPIAELQEIFGSAAGRIIAREMGLDAATRDLLAAGAAELSDSDAQALARSLERVRERYLDSRPQDELVFESAAEDDEPLYLRAKQQDALLESLQGVAAEDTQFVRIGESLQTYRARAAQFLAGAAPAELPPLPEEIRLSINKELAARTFGVARDESGLVSLTPEAKLELKARRKEASILRNAFAMLSDGHEPPAAIQAFARDFGRLNDAIENGLSDLVRQYAKDLLKSLDAARITRALDRFEPAGRSSFERYFKRLLKSIGAQVAADELPVEEFHDLRKELKEIMNLLYLSEQLGSIPERKAAYAFLYDLNTEMGLMHDELVGGDLRGEIKYKKQKVSMPPRQREAVRDVLGRIHLGD
jgi:hypothetical protein